jgi:hypothetical protein
MIVVNLLPDLDVQPFNLLIHDDMRDVQTRSGEHTPLHPTATSSLPETEFSVLGSMDALHFGGGREPESGRRLMNGVPALGNDELQVFLPAIGDFPLRLFNPDEYCGNRI